MTDETIETLKSDNETMGKLLVKSAEENTRLRAENARLREANKFSAKHIDNALHSYEALVSWLLWPYTLRSKLTPDSSVLTGTRKDLRAARAAMGETE